ncbi:DUF3885 domain-containing protein [Aneurinibacillus aneurinilyticus]|uniref:DUF3885 domain-containing protein n=1 Tax=Aneurinibacillus aneurinilyticus TaxID=1391 RepID=UPI0023F3DC4F|nr:DUF3885 domain-containing protein [Aneurinibacillus aneurinilyticus]
MNSYQLLQQYMCTHFPNVGTCKPLFYNMPIGIRFEIGNPDFNVTVENGYMEQVYHRSIELFKEIHSNSDELFLIVNAHRHFGLPSISKSKRVNVFKKYIKDKNLLYKLNAVELPYIYDKEEMEFRTYQYVLRCKVADIRYSSLLRAIGNQDMGVRPKVFDECFFINTTRHTIFNLYDDRGLDIASNCKGTLKELYIKYNDWILDYDREQIDEIFST